jgi:signal transduction histidine kinase
LLETPGNSCHNQVRLKHKNGNWVWCDATLTNMLDESGIEAMVSNFRDISDKKATENQQEFETNNLNALINNTKDLMWSVDRNYNLITSNIPFDEAGKVNFGKAIAKGENVLSASYTPEMLSHFKELYERAFAGESFTEIERFHLPFELWTQISYYPIRKGNNIIGTACHSRDITGIKKIEQQLSKSEAFNRGVLNSLSSHIAVINDLGNIVAVNESWKQFAIENGDTSLLRTAKGTNYFSVCKKAAESGDEIAHEVLLGMKAILDEKDSNFYLEYPCHSPNEQRWFGMRAMKFDSDAPMIVVAHMDITERKLAEEKLIESEARLKEAQAIAHISNWEYDLITNKSVWSDEFYSILGINRNEIKASPELFLSMIHPDDFEFAKSKVDKTFQTFESESFSVRIINKNGNIRYVFTEWKTEFDTNNNPIRLFGILKDETERKIAEDEREKLILDILQRNRDLEQFTFIISHNLRAPTANIIGFTEILNNEKLSLLEQKELLHGLASSVSGLDTIIKDINSILQVKREINDKKEVVVFSKLVNDIIVSIEKVIDMHNVRFTIDFSDVDEMFSLKAYMHSIFYNLISNSIKYRNPDIQPLIEIKSKQEHKKIILTFKDNGLGIDLKTKGDKIFGLYKRFHSHVEGKGLGLFMVKTQVEAIGGKISLTSEVNKGTEFTIEFEI